MGKKDLGASSGSREPSPAVSALSGFDPARGACATPLAELLRQIPVDARLEIEHSPVSYSMHPVGRMCHEAAELIEQQEAEIKRLRAFIESVATGQAFREQRFAEDSDPDYFLRAQRNVQLAARAALNASERTAQPPSQEP